MHRVTRGVFDLGASDHLNGWIVFVGERFGGSRSLLQAVESEFVDCEIVVANDIDVLLEKDMGYWSAARLVIIDCRICCSAREHQAELKSMFSDATMVIAYDDRKRQDQEILASLDCELVRGFLPMNLQLDIWLSAIRLMLNGGEYMPVELLEIVNRSTFAYGSSMPKADPRYSNSSKEMPDEQVQPASRLSSLTDRELDVLRLAAQGRQNKIIAVRLGISEHTIKLHMHHIISKLGAHNRTEAAAAYLQHFSAADG